MALEAYTGCHPFSPDHFHYENVLYSIANCTKVNLPPSLSPEFTDWLHLALQRDPEQRPNASELLSHAWMTKEYSPDDLERAQRSSVSHLKHGAMWSGGVSNGLAFDSWEY